MDREIKFQDFFAFEKSFVVLKIQNDFYSSFSRSKKFYQVGKSWRRLNFLNVKEAIKVFFFFYPDLALDVALNSFGGKIKEVPFLFI